MQIVFCDTNPDVIAALKSLYDEYQKTYGADPGWPAAVWNSPAGVSVHLDFQRGDILNELDRRVAGRLVCDTDCVAIVSPANSFGFMDGGIDARYQEAWPGLQRQVQCCIRDSWDGEIPVGCADSESICTLINGASLDLIIAPTMRTPQYVASTLNVYLAMRAILLEARKMEYSHVFCPGLCTCSGGMPTSVAAAQMFAAIRGRKVPVDLWDEAKWEREVRA